MARLSEADANGNVLQEDPKKHKTYVYRLTTELESEKARNVELERDLQRTREDLKTTHTAAQDASTDVLRIYEAVTNLMCKLHETVRKVFTAALLRVDRMHKRSDEVARPDPGDYSSGIWNGSGVHAGAGCAVCRGLNGLGSTVGTGGGGSDRDVGCGGCTDASGAAGAAGPRA